MNQQSRQSALRRGLLLVCILPLMAQQCPTAPEAQDACTLGTRDHRPVIFIAGTFSPGISHEQFLGHTLAQNGYTYCVLELNEGEGLVELPGTAPIRQSAQGLAIFVERVLSWSGESQVDLVGHSQGALVGRDYIKFVGGAPKVATFISVAGPNDGTDAAALSAFLWDLALRPFGHTCEDVFPCIEMQQNSEFIDALNEGDDTPGALDYYSFYSANDTLVWHWTTGPFGVPFVAFDNAKLRDGATNVRIDSQCPGRFVSHIGMILDPAVHKMVSDALAGRPIQVPLSTCLSPPVSLPS